MTTMTTTSTNNSQWSLLSLLLLLLNHGMAFTVVSPVPRLFHGPSMTTSATTSARTSTTQSQLVLDPTWMDSTSTVTTSTVTMADAGSIVESAGGVLRTVAVVITALVFLVAGLTFVTASVLIPAAAKELEQECLELAPELWEEYQGYLEEGQTIDQRPDLMQALGQKLEPFLDAKIAQQIAEKQAQGIDMTEDEKAWQDLNKWRDQTPLPKQQSQSQPQDPQQQNPNAQVLDLSSMTNEWDDDDDTAIVDAQVISRKQDKDEPHP